MTMASGCPIAHARYSMTAGPTGPVLFQDRSLVEKLQHFDRERLPPRNVHALGFGAFGTFTVTSDEITKYTCAKLFSSVGKTTEIMTRFSGVFTLQGEADTFRDLRGFAAKFYTEEGNWDLLSVNTPVFGARDAKAGPDNIHAFKRDSRTGEWNSTQFWDFVCTHPESLTNALMIFMDKVGTPMSFRYQNFFPCNTYSFINAEKKRCWIRFHLISEQGWKGLTRQEAALIAGEDPDYLHRDLRQAIFSGMYPKWRLCFQVMTEEEGYQKPHIAFDVTKMWLEADYPLHEIGVLEVNRYPDDFHTQVEQVAFSPGNVVPGISFSPDRLLQGRIFLYDDTQTHRLGPNFKQIPINAPRCVVPHTPYVDGLRHDSKTAGLWPSYYPSLFGGLAPDSSYTEPMLKVDGDAGFYPFPGEGTDQDYYAQIRGLLKTCQGNEMTTFVDNLGYSLHKVTDKVVEGVMAHLGKIDSTFASLVNQAANEYRSGKRKTPATDLLKQLNDLLLGGGGRGGGATVEKVPGPAAAAKKQTFEPEMVSAQ